MPARAVEHDQARKQRKEVYEKARRVGLYDARWQMNRYRSLASVHTFQTTFEGRERPVLKFFVKSHMLRIVPFACVPTPLEVSAFHRVARDSKRCSEVFARSLVPPAAKLKLAKRC